MRRSAVPSLVVVLGVLAALALSGCGALVATAAMDFDISLEPSEVTATPGSEVEITVKVSYLVPLEVFPLPLIVTLHDAPDYVSAEELEIPPGITEDELTLSIDPDAFIGETEKNLTVRATNGMKTKEASFRLTVVESH